MPFGLFTEPKEASVSTRGKSEEEEVCGGEEKCEGGRRKGVLWGRRGGGEVRIYLLFPISSILFLILP